MKSFIYTYAWLVISAGTLGACGNDAQTVLKGEKGDPGMMGVSGETGLPGSGGLPGAQGMDGRSYESVTPLSMKGWQFAATNTASVMVVSGSAEAWPYNFTDPGAGSVMYGTGSGDGVDLGGKPYIGYSGLNYLPLSRLESLVWRTNVPSPAPNLSATGSGYWNIYIYLGAPADISVNPTNYDNLVVDPAYFPDAGYAPKTGVWQALLADGATKVRCRYQKLKVGPNPTDFCVKDAPYALSVFKQYNPAAFIMPAWCAEIPYRLPNGALCDPVSPVVNLAAPGITFMAGQRSGGVWKDFQARANGFEFGYDGYSARFVFRGQ